MSDCISDCVEISNNKNDGNVAPNIIKCIKRIAQIEGFHDYKVEVQDFTTNGGNYMAILEAINIREKTETAFKEISLFVKNKLPSYQESIIPLNEFYKREVFYYNELSTIYDELQDKANIPIDERLRRAKSYNESNLEAIILENLSKKGYTVRPRLEPISLQFAEISVKQLAKFHALSFVLKCKKPEYYEMKVKPLTNLGEVNTEWEDYVVTACTAAANCLDYDSKDGDIKDLIVVDYQTIRYGSPVIDFIFFIFIGSDQEFRRAHLDELKELYYETLERFMGEFGVEVHDVYPKNRFEQEYRENLDVGLTMFLVFAPLVLCSANDVPDLHNDSASKVNFSCFDNAKCKERLRGIVEDFTQWGYL